MNNCYSGSSLVFGASKKIKKLEEDGFGLSVVVSLVRAFAFLAQRKNNKNNRFSFRISFFTRTTTKKNNNNNTSRQGYDIYRAVNFVLLYGFGRRKERRIFSRCYLSKQLPFCLVVFRSFTGQKASAENSSKYTNQHQQSKESVGCPSSDCIPAGGNVTDNRT